MLPYFPNINSLSCLLNLYGNLLNCQLNLYVKNIMEAYDYHLSHRGSLLSYLYANPRRFGCAYFNKWTRNLSATRYLYIATQQEKTGNSWPL